MWGTVIPTWGQFNLKVWDIMTPKGGAFWPPIMGGFDPKMGGSVTSKFGTMRPKIVGQYDLQFWGVVTPNFRALLPQFLRHCATHWALPPPSPCSMLNSSSLTPLLFLTVSSLFPLGFSTTQTVGWGLPVPSHLSPWEQLSPTLPWEVSKSLSSDHENNNKTLAVGYKIPRSTEGPGRIPGYFRNNLGSVKSSWNSSETKTQTISINYFFFWHFPPQNLPFFWVMDAFFVGRKVGKVGVQVIFKESLVGLGFIWWRGVTQHDGMSLVSLVWSRKEEGLWDGRSWERALGMRNWCAPGVWGFWGPPRRWRRLRWRARNSAGHWKPWEHCETKLSWHI